MKIPTPERGQEKEIALTRTSSKKGSGGFVRTAEW